jgi:hypothetical protein
MNTCIHEQAQNIGGMIMMEENQSTWRKTFSSVTLFTTNLTWIGLGLNTGLCGEKKNYT